MLRRLRVSVLAVAALLLCKAGLRLASGTTGSAEKAVVLAIGCVWLVAVVQNARPAFLKL